ncbi:unnamed protein product [Allacma fusca]|uniref:Nucleolar protein 16 n=1 Tax=Allacma fusca TaxID=39272 RepID=A0A8J2PTX9_9HEXA|nr:unnamed protein product [Allacma fusca]
MPRLRKLRRKQKFQYHVNRKQLNNKHKKLPRINCEAVREAWDKKKSLTDNLTSMGLVADANRNISQNPKNTLEAENSPEAPCASVAVALEKEAKEAFKVKKAVAHPLPPEMYRKLCGLINKHGEDFEAMEKDPTNYYQETAAQLRSQVNRLKKIPQQWIPYLKERGLLPTENDDQ